MHSIKQALVFCIAFITINSYAQVPFKQPGFLQVRIHYKDLNSTEGYKWASSGAKADLYLNDQIFVEKCDCPIISGTQIPRLGVFKNFTIAGSWFNLLGEFAANPGFIWEYKDFFTVNGEKAVHLIDKKKYAKYPSLLKRLKYATPSNVNLTINLEVADKSGKKSMVFLKIKDNDLLIGGEGEMPLMVPGAPENWSDILRIENLASADVVDLRKRWSEFVSVGNQVSITVNSLTIPIKELIAIDELYQKYEREDKELTDQYKMLEPGYKQPLPANPYAKADEWSKPYEQEIKTAKVFRGNGKVGLRSGDKIVFESSDHNAADSLPGSSKFFSFFNSESHSLEIFNAKGKRLTLDGLDEFQNVVTSKMGDDMYDFVTSIERSDQPVYKTRIKYTSFSAFRDPYYTAEEFNELKAEDVQAYNNRPSSRGGGRPGEVTLGMSPDPAKFYAVTVITTDKNLRVLKRQIAYRVGW